MTTGKGSAGFTIVETIIVLAVTSLGIAIALNFISGKQRNTEFHQAVNDIQSQISEVISNVQNGYYAKSDDFDCNSVGGHPNINFASTSSLGTNQDCTYVGRAIQFWVRPDDNTFKVYSLVGNRIDNTTNTDVKDIIKANPRTIFPLPNGPSMKKLLYGLEVKYMKYGTNNSTLTNQTTGTVAFISSFDQAINGGSGTVNMYAIQGNSLNDTDNATRARLDMNNAVNYDKATSLTICFDGGTELFGVIAIGGTNAFGANNRPLNATLKFTSKSAPGLACS